MILIQKIALFSAKALLLLVVFSIGNPVEAKMIRLAVTKFSAPSSIDAGFAKLTNLYVGDCLVSYQSDTFRIVERKDLFDIKIFEELELQNELVVLFDTTQVSEIKKTSATHILYGEMLLFSGELIIEFSVADLEGGFVQFHKTCQFPVHEEQFKRAIPAICDSLQAGFTKWLAGKQIIKPLSEKKQRQPPSLILVTSSYDVKADDSVCIPVKAVNDEDSNFRFSLHGNESWCRLYAISNDSAVIVCKPSIVDAGKQIKFAVLAQASAGYQYAMISITVKSPFPSRTKSYLLPGTYQRNIGSNTKGNAFTTMAAISAVTCIVSMYMTHDYVIKFNASESEYIRLTETEELSAAYQKMKSIHENAEVSAIIRNIAITSLVSVFVLNIIDIELSQRQRYRGRVTGNANTSKKSFFTFLVTPTEIKIAVSL